MRGTSACVLSCAVLAAFTCLAAKPERASKSEPSVQSASDVLDMSSLVRWHAGMKPPQVDAGGALVPLKPAIVNYNQLGDALESPAAPAGWEGADFDDSLWPHTRMEWARDLAFSHFSTHRVFFRFKFAVSDPAQAALKFSCSYRGGVIVSVNGQEVARGGLPAGKLEADTPADAYPDDAYVGKSGAALPGPDRLKGLSEEDRKDVEERVARRTRKLEGVALPAQALRKGVNVLAIEVRRANYHSSAAGWFTKAGANTAPWWVTANLSSLRLEGTGATANTARPQGPQVWVQDRSDRVSLMDYADPNEALGTARIFGARNGIFCAQIVVGDTAAIKEVSATPSALKGAKGEIPAAAVSVLYGLPDMQPYGCVPWFLGLSGKPPAQADVQAKYGAALQEVLVRVAIPKNAAPGLYQGKITVAASGKSVDVPLQVNVSDWSVPDPKDYRTYIGAYQSPISVALQYNVKPWSEEHWKYMEKSFALLGRVGNKMINVSVVDETQFGEPEGMISWIKKADGSYDYDFSLFDRYLALAMKHCGKQEFVCLQLWHAGGWEARPVDNKCTVQVRDEKGGAAAPMQVPKWGTPEATAFWKPFFAKMQERLEKQGMPEAMTVGILSDSTAPNEVFQTTAAAWPKGPARWHRGCHGHTDSPKPYNVSRGSENNVVLHEHCYGMSMVSPQLERLPLIHEFRGRPGTAYQRISNHETTASVLSFKLMTENGIWCQKQGIGRICLDFWPVLKGNRGNSDVYNRYPHSSCAQREPSLKRLSTAGPDGAEPSLNYEAFAEGLLETEALMVVSRGGASEATVGKELAEKCRALARERLMFCHARDQMQYSHPFYHLDHYGWQDLAKRTFDLAGEVGAKMGK
jgi:hypothetical protein